MSPFSPLKYQLYLFQLENYDIKRYWKLYWRKVRAKPFAPQRQKLVWTPKAALLFSVAIFLASVLASIQIFNFANPWLKAIFLAAQVFIYANLLSPLLLIVAAIIIWPFDYSVKQVIINRAKAGIKKFKNLKVVAIAGSFGKTTMKEVLAAVLEVKYKILKTPESVNTPVGISRLILKELDPSLRSAGPPDVFIVEMGAYRRGDIQALCAIARPDIAVLTGINEAHLERFGSLDNTIKAKFEIVENSREGALVLLNDENELVRDNYKRYIGDSRGIFYSKNSPPAPLFSKEGMGELKIPILGEYIWGIINACVIIATELGLTDDEIRRGIQNIKPIPHRLQLIKNPNGITVIDDSYNGNPDGVREAIKVLSKFTNKRKIYITPGLVETGSRVKIVHNEIGEQLNKVADLVILIKNSVTLFVAEKLNKDKVLWFDSAPEAHAALPKILKPGDVVMFQNDWPDNYL